MSSSDCESGANCFCNCWERVRLHIIKHEQVSSVVKVLNQGGNLGHGDRRSFLLPVGTAFHERTFPLCQSLNYREWSGYYAVSVYEVHHEHEYNAIRNAAALIDITPLYKYLLSGRDATKLVNRIITRDINKVAKGQVTYCCWCDEQGKVVDDGTITRLDENRYRWTAAEPNLRWFHQNGLNMD